MSHYDLYESLGLLRHSTADDLGTQIDARVAKLRGEGVEDRDGRIQELLVARQILGNPVKKGMYDDVLEDASIPDVGIADLRQLANAHVPAPGPVAPQVAATTMEAQVDVPPSNSGNSCEPVAVSPIQQVSPASSPFDTQIPTPPKPQATNPWSLPESNLQTAQALPMGANARQFSATALTSIKAGIGPNVILNSLPVNPRNREAWRAAPLAVRVLSVLLAVISLLNLVQAFGMMKMISGEIDNLSNASRGRLGSGGFQGLLDSFTVTLMLPFLLLGLVLCLGISMYTTYLALSALRGQNNIVKLLIPISSAIFVSLFFWINGLVEMVAKDSDVSTFFMLYIVLFGSAFVISCFPAVYKWFSQKPVETR